MDDEIRIYKKIFLIKMCTRIENIKKNKSQGALTHKSLTQW